MELLSLFSGIGAFEKALTNLAIPYRLGGFCEVDNYAIKSYCAIHNIDEKLNLGDITKIDKTSIPMNVDVVSYGFPCQDISIASSQRGLIDTDGTITRSGLFYNALDIIEYSRPSIAIAENVKNLTSKKFSQEFQDILLSLEKLGYNNYWQILNARDYTMPQNRERVFIVSIRKDIDTGKFKFPKEQLLKLRLKDMLEEEVDERFYISSEKLDSVKKDFAYIFEEDVPEGRTDIIRRLCNIYPTKTRANPNQGRVYDIRYIAPTLCGRGNNQPHILYNNKIRRLTPKEYYRLMGFSDEDFAKAEALNSNTQLYRQAGNSIVVPVIENIVLALIESGAMKRR